MERHNLSSLKVAKFLEDHPKVIKVSHPLLTSNPYRDLASKQNRGRHSGMVAVYLKGGRSEVRCSKRLYLDLNIKAHSSVPLI